jgi:large repetitive protein
VQFYVDGSALGSEDTSAPYAASWDTTQVANGSHTLTARARDAAGNTTTSAAVTVTVSNAAPPDTTPPSVSITAPLNGVTVSGTTPVTANASDNVGVVGVQFFVDGSALGAEDTAAPYSVSWNTSQVANGGHALTARARDAAGNTNSSATVNVTVSNAPAPDTTPPSVSITAPVNGASVSGTTSIAATASDNVGVVGVQFFVDGSALGSEDTNAPYSTSWNTRQIADGAHALTARARDAAGNTNTSATVNVTVANAPAPDTTLPTVSITAPANGATVAGTTSVTANASDNVGVAGVQFFVDGSALGAEDTAAPYSVSWSTTQVANGAHALTARARDAAGNTGTSPAINVTVSNAAPTQSPYFGTPFTVPGQIEAENFDKGGEGVAYHDAVAGNAGGLYRSTEDVDIISPYAGGYVVNNFQTGEWLEYTINVTTTATYKIETLVSSEFTTSAFHVDIDGVNKTGTVAIPSTGLWTTFQWIAKDGIALSAGQHVLRITADIEYFNFDAMRISTSTTPPPPDTTAPSVSITAPLNGASVSGATSVIANASDNVGVVGVQFYVDNAPLGAEDTTAPYAASWDTTQSANGSYTVTARARDAAGNTNNSAAVAVTVSNTAPAATQSPYTGTPFTVPGQFEAEDFDKGGEGVAYHDVVPGNAGGSYRPNEDVDITGLFAGGYVVNNSQTGEWLEYTINVTASGTYAIEALVSSMFTGSQFQVSIDDVDKTSLIAVPNTGAWETFQWVGKSGINLTTGPHVLRLTSAVEYFNVDALRITQELPTSPPPPAPDTTAPTVSITAPSDGSTASGIVLVNANASDNVGVAGVLFFVDGAPLLAEDTSDPYSVSWDTTLASNAPHMLTAVARDAAGNSTMSAAVQVSVRNIVPDTTPPTVAITAPSYGASVSGIVQVAANATDNVAVVGVQFYVDGVALGAEATSAPYVVMWDTTRSANGSHILTAVARDAAGNTASAAGDQVMVANGATGSSVSITSPTEGATVTGTVQVTANAPAGTVGVRFYVDGNSIGLEDNFAPFGVSWDSITSPDGSHTVTAVSRDLAGNIMTSAPVSVTVKNAAPRKRGGPRH